MLRRVFDPRKRYRVILYLRMSSEQQNPCSPEQQRATIEATIKRLNLPWVIVKVYVDRAISGRYLAKREGFQSMLRDVRTKSVKADLVLVDTFERFGRSDEVAAIRKELHRHYGCLVLTADTQFADPTSTAGQALSAFEAMRATDGNRIKSHDVSRGKRFAAENKRWPGGAPPFGYRLRSVLVERNGRTEVDHSVLEPDPKTAHIIRLAFERAHETGEGCTRLARWLTAHPEISDEFKPFSDQTVNGWLGNALYKGLMIWEKVSTDVIDDRRVVEKNPEENFLKVPGFCEPLVPEAVWDAVNELRETRGRRRCESDAGESATEKQLMPLVAGVSLKFPLAGLVVCAHCGLAMIPNSSPAYTLKSTGETHRYVSYVCPRAASGVCDNKTRVPESWLREQVFELLRSRLFPNE